MVIPGKLSELFCFCFLYALFNSVTEFFHNAVLELSLKFESIKRDIAYMSDFFSKLNEVNKQGDDVLLNRVKSTTSTFQVKLMDQRNIERGEFFV